MKPIRHLSLSVDTAGRYSTLGLTLGLFTVFAGINNLAEYGGAQIRADLGLNTGVR